MKIYVKNMISKSCVLYVKKTLDELGIKPVRVGLGVIVTEQNFSGEKLIKLNQELERAELELCEKKEDQLSEKVKHAVIDYVYNINEMPYQNFSDLLSKKLGYSYNYLSNVFYKQNKITLQQYVIRIKIERVKELIMMGEHSLTEISYRLQYSSCAHLSNQFKKVMGLAPSKYKKQNGKGRLSLQEV